MRKWITILLSGTLYSIVFQLCYNWMRWLTPWPYSDLHEVSLSFVLNLLPILVLCISTGVIVFRPALIKKSWIKVSLDVVMAAVSLVVVNFLFNLFSGYPVEWGGSVFNAIFILLGIETYYYVVRYNNSVRMEAQSREKALRYKYEALKAQIDPHFLFNSLNILSSLIALDPGKASGFIVSLSRMYRYIMAQEDKECVSVDEELNFLHHYIEILEMRYTGQFSVDISIENDEVRQRKIIPYTLQLLMENVIKHNIISSRYPMQVDIHINGNGIRFTNPVTAKRAETVSRVGTRYLTNLYALYGKIFTAENDNNVYVVNVPFID